MYVDDIRKRYKTRSNCLKSSDFTYYFVFLFFYLLNHILLIIIFFFVLFDFCNIPNAKSRNM